MTGCGGGNARWGHQTLSFYYWYGEFMELTKLRDYLLLLQRAEVELVRGKRRQLFFNGVESPGEYASRVMAAEMEMWPVLAILLRMQKDQVRINRLLRAYVDEMEVVLNIQRSLPYPHFYLDIREKKELVDWKKLSEQERKKLESFLEVQRKSFFRQRAFITGKECCRGADYFLKEGMDMTDWLELGNALFTTGNIVAGGGNQSKKSFILYLFECFGASFPPHYDRQVGQIQDRQNPTIFLDRLKKEYKEYLMERLRR